MQLFRYYKGAERELRWKAIEVEREASRLASEDVMFATVLAVSEKPGKGEAVSENAKYQGPFFVDIDSESIPSSIKTAKAVINKLTLNGVHKDSICVWASGKKGFHITLPMGVFTEEAPVSKLPLIYKQMAIAMKLFDIEDVDATVYSTGRGRMWRLENKLRPDNGKYKVRLTVDEVLDMTSDRYDEIISAPRDFNPKVRIERVSLLEALFKMCKGKADSMEKPKGIFIDPNLKEALEGNLPPCAENLKDFRNIKDGKGFNDISLQFAKALSSFAPERSDELMEEFAKNATGHSYNTPAKRKDHCRRAFKISSRNAGYDWSCKAALSVLRSEPCFSCPIAFIRVQEDENEEGRGEQGSVQEASEKGEVGESKGSEAGKKDRKKDKKETESSGGITKEAVRNSETSSKSADVESGYNLEGLLATDEGYGFMDGGGKFRRVSNFTLKITKVFVEYIPLLEMDRRVAIQAEVFINKAFSGMVYLEEGNWNSKSGFISSFAGLANAAFYGKDDDVQKMKSALMLGLDSSTEIRKVTSSGIHSQIVGDQTVFTYVEPGWSIDQFGNENLYTLTGKLTAYPKLRSVPLPVEGDPKISTLIENLLKVNQPQKVAQVLGWNVACFLAEHIFTFRNEFPLLSLHGEVGSGKTSTAALFSAIHGVDYRTEFSPINLPGTTAFPVWSFISQSNTVPRLFEEFNKSKMLRTYDSYVENFKSCWNRHSVTRGTLANVKLHGGSPTGAAIQEIKLTGPVVICSEQAINVPAMVERCVQVRFSKEDKDGKDYVEAFEYCSEHMRDFLPLAKALYMEALTLDPKQIKSWIEVAGEFVPKEISDNRPRYCYQMVFTGLSYMQHLCDIYKLPCLASVRKVREEFLEWLHSNASDISSVKKTSEVDLIMQKLAVMAAISQGDGSLPWLVKGQHYIKDGDSLFLDPIVAHGQYLRYTNQVERSVPVIDSFREFMALIKGEKYCKSTSEVREGFARNRKVLRLSVYQMDLKKIPVEAFED